ncbi:MAG: glutathione peroxidase [Candidatus Riflebacteria bacterium]|nr:glutathione peroxidase [Candidatus Riflebacteria bacterium]
MAQRSFSWLSGFRFVAMVLVVIGAVHWIRHQRPVVRAGSPPLPSSIYDFSLLDIDGKPVLLSQWRGKVLLIVNVASKCGFTGQYAGLQKLYESYQDQGLEILGFPANDFLWQEPGSNDEIKSFCSLKYKVTFPMFNKISVTGRGIHPLYRFLTDQMLHQAKVGKVSWNFNKFLIDRSGKVVAHFGSKIEPQSAEMVGAIEAAIKKPESPKIEENQ